jgi:hypothetical protein
MIELAKALEAENAHYPVDLPEKKEGDWRIVHNKVKEQGGLNNLRAIRDGIPEAVVSDGDYVVLANGSSVVMSNTQFEYRTNKPIIEVLSGDILISGLGLGMVLRPLAENKNVLSITVLEKSPEVIAMVAQHYADIENLRIIEADVFYWKPDRKFDMAYHDIWSEYGSDMLDDVKVLKKKYRRYAKQQFFWAENIAKRMKKIEGRW